MLESEVLIGAVQKLAGCRDVNEVRRIVRRTARELTGADGATFVLRDGGLCHYVDEDAIAPLWKGSRFDMSQCVSGWVMNHAEPVVIPDIYEDVRVPHEAYRPTFVQSMAMVPIRSDQPVGAIGNYWASHYEATERDIALLQALADSTSVAMESIRAMSDLRVSQNETLERLALAAEYRDDDTLQHTNRVAGNSELIALQMGVDEAEAALIRKAAPLHDIGKISVPDAILLKPGRLTEDEFATIKLHPEAGGKILGGSRAEVLQRAEEIALTHHEWWDGGGYPKGMAGEDIPLAGRIVALADVFDALTHDRPYKSAWRLEDAQTEIHRLRGLQFDPAVVDAFGRLNTQALAI